MGAEKGRKTRSRQHRPDSGGMPQAQRGAADRKGRDFAAAGELDRRLGEMRRRTTRPHG
jgi:hypothetical protein